MRIIRSQVQWQTIFKNQVNSELTIVDFCRVFIPELRKQQLSDGTDSLAVY
jgi:hypothetical protein